nr:MFS transporter [Azospirillum sp. SYSU D00513]
MGRDAIPDEVPSDYLVVGRPEYRRASRILFVAGFATFATLYCVQPLMPEFVAAFGVTPAESSLSLSLGTGFLAVSMLVAGTLSDRIGRKPVMIASLLLSGAFGLFAALAPDWPWLLVLRALVGVALSGLPAVAMAYVSEEVDPRSAGVTMGLYIGGTALGGMAGRVLTAVVADLTNWRVAIAVIGGLSLVAAAAVWAGLPASRHFVRRQAGMAQFLAAWRGHLTNPGLLRMFAIGFLSIGGFVTVFNYVSFRLIQPPFDLRPAVAGAVFVVYLTGVVSSPLFGGLAAQLGRGRVMLGAALMMAVGLALMWPDSLWTLAPGIALFTFAFFGMHSIASGWIGQIATANKAQASSMYLFCYYMGSTLSGTVGGLFWHDHGWAGVTAFVGVFLLMVLMVAARLALLGQPGRVPKNSLESPAE